MIPYGPRSAGRRRWNIGIALGGCVVVALSGLGVESASAATKSRLVVSSNADRSSAVRLDGSTVSGEIYVFVRNSKNLDKVDFYIDSPRGRKKSPVRSDKKPPFDLAGTRADGSARPYNTAKLAEGTHTIRVEMTWTDGTTSTRRGRLKVGKKDPTTTAPTSPSTTGSAAPDPTTTTPASAPEPTTTAPASPTTTTAASSPTTTTAASSPTTTTAASSPTTTTAASSPTTTRPATATPTSQAPTSCASGGGVAIGTGDNAQSVVNAHGAGTTYIVKAGTHLRNFSVQPKSGDKFCGEPGAVLDGGRSLSRAIYGGATNVILDSITVKDYDPGWQGAAIQPQSHATGWVVRNVSALHNGWAGLLVADGMKILGGHYNDNDQLGIGGNEATGILVDGLDGDPTTIDGPEMARNHTLHASCLWEAGGMKWDFGKVTVRNAYVHDNDCKGLWADINAHDAVIEHNLVEDNRGEGILYEISQDAVIRNNKVYGNGYAADGWYWDAGITVYASFNVEVYGNRLSGNYSGITGVQQDRFDSSPPQHLLNNLKVYDNLICATNARGHATGVGADNGANLGSRDISFTNNTVQSAECKELSGFEE
jgi:parallel beta-helix repeat protein